MNRYNVRELSELMEAFYRVSGIRFILFDAEYRKVAAYPEQDGPFCRMIKENPDSARFCLHDDRSVFERCAREGLTVYECHAGLTEAAVALKKDQTVIGYLMLGQITREKDRAALVSYGSRFCRDEVRVRRAVRRIPHKTADEIRAAAKIMEACTGYIYLRELIGVEQDRKLDRLRAYIEDHLGEALTVRDLCEASGLGKTTLYEVFAPLGGVASYVRERRLLRARDLIRTTDQPISAIAQTVGFSDYNYFSKVYKKRFSHPPKGERGGENGEILTNTNV